MDPSIDDFAPDLGDAQLVSGVQRERLVAAVGTLVVAIAAVGAVLASDELEVTFFMVAAVIAGLVCFDRSMRPSLGSFAPWVLVSLAPISKTIPTVWYELTKESGARFERYDHVGSLLFGACLLGAVLIVARPSRTLGRSTTSFDAAAITGSAATGGLAGASVAFLFDRDFGSATAARVLETSTWFVIGALLASSAIAVSHHREVSRALAGVLATAAATAGLLAFSVAGQDFDLGWWALLFVALALSAVAAGGALGQRVERDRRSVVPVVVAIVAGLIAAAAAISARGDRTSWGPGWMLLGVVSLAMFALAMASRPLDEPIKDTRPKGTDPQDIGVQDEVRTFRTSALDPDPAQSLSPPAPSQPAESQPVALEPAPTRAAQTYVGESLSDRSIVASAQAAAAVRTAPSAQRHSLAPLAQAHHFDPSTGLLSAAGLQHAIERAFDVPRQAGHVTIMMFTIRDLGRIEDEHGRLASAAVTREVAKRVNALLPGGSGARFARSAYAVVFVGDHSDAPATIQWLAQVLVQLRTPVEGASLGAKMDVVGGMAQCYESEDAAQFVKRANLALARSVESSEPTFVAMP